MSLTFAITPDAQADIQDAHSWYEARRIGRGDEFVVELYDRINEVCSTPKQFGRVQRKVRAAMLPTSQFIIYYRIESFGIVITAVQHARAHPSKWKRRK